MKISSQKRIYEQDYGTQYQELMQKLGILINGNFEVLFDAVDGKLGFKDNVASTITTFTVSVDASGTPRTAVSFALDSTQTQVQGLTVINCVGSKANPYPNAVPFISFTQNENKVIVNNIKGLVADVQYSIKVLVI